jgi:hypothetical protein
MSTPKGVPFLFRALTVTVPAHSYVRNRKSERCRRQARQGRERHNFRELSDHEISRLLTELPGESTQ